MRGKNYHPDVYYLLLNWRDKVDSSQLNKNVTCGVTFDEYLSLCVVELRCSGLGSGQVRGGDYLMVSMCQQDLSEGAVYKRKSPRQPQFL